MKKEGDFIKKERVIKFTIRYFGIDKNVVSRLVNLISDDAPNYSFSLQELPKFCYLVKLI